MIRFFGNARKTVLFRLCVVQLNTRRAGIRPKPKQGQRDPDCYFRLTYNNPNVIVSIALNWFFTSVALFNIRVNYSTESFMLSTSYSLFTFFLQSSVKSRFFCAGLARSITNFYLFFLKYNFRYFLMKKYFVFIFLNLYWLRSFNEPPIFTNLNTVV